jgi:hypothetical protein
LLIVFCKIDKLTLLNIKFTKNHQYFEIERDFFNKLGVLIDGDFKFGVLLLVFIA